MIELTSSEVVYLNIPTSSPRIEGGEGTNGPSAYNDAFHYSYVFVMVTRQR